MRDLGAPKAGIARLFCVVRELSLLPAGGGGLIRIARSAGLTQATTHRLLQSLAAEGLVEQDAGRRLYRLGADFFALALQASHPGELRLLCRPALRRLSAGLGESVVLFARSEGDAVCVDRSEGMAATPAPDAAAQPGLRIALGRDAAPLAILAFLPEAEREQLLRARSAAAHDAATDDTAELRADIDRARQAGHAERRGHGHGHRSRAGAAAVAVPIVDRGGRAVASLAIDTTADRLGPDRLPMVLDRLKQEAAAIGLGIAPFDALPLRPVAARLGRPR
ncbi:IclR family transcriptional regulator [Variovorax sp. PvP013]|uniref:IclR family transcriptional regulator n=1 Tax=Variovorax sp. PvP013 TaxID=3156435 RepID=UPI003D1E1227